MQWTIPLLLEKGYEVRGVDNFARYGQIERKRDYEFLIGDLTDSAFTEKATKGVDGVVQAAALIYGVGGFHLFPADILGKDVTLQQNILWAMLKNDVQNIAYISSSMVYERCLSYPSKEEDVDHSLIPLTDYGLSKLVGERLCKAFARQYDINYTIWRPFNIITPYEKGETKQGTSHVFADFIRNIVLEKMSPLPLIGDGQQIRCFTWIEDIARGIAHHSFTPPAHNNVFNLGNPEPITMRNLAQLIHDTARTMGLLGQDTPPLEFETKLSFSDDVLRRIPDVTKAKEVLNWEPSLQVAKSVERCLKQLN